MTVRCQSGFSDGKSIRSSLLVELLGAMTPRSRDPWTGKEVSSKFCSSFHRHSPGRLGRPRSLAGHAQFSSPEI